jgi:glycosyltransferase involved in cell wall biosynthesis
LAVIVTARNEADRIGATLRALREAFPGAELWVADDASGDGTQHVALQEGARVVRAPKRLGKGGAATLAAEQVDAKVVVFADGDLGESARELPKLVAALGADALTADAGGADAGGADVGGADAGGADAGGADVAIASFAQRVGGGFGIALTAARWAVRRAANRHLDAPLSGQRAIRGEALPSLLPFAPGFGMETGMNIDALRAGLRVVEVELDLEHRATGKTLAGFAHRGRQLRDILRAYASRRS